MGIFNVMFIGGLVLSIVFLIATIVMFFLLDIPKAIGVVTGNTQRKAIEEIRAGGQATTSKRGKGSKIQARDIDLTISNLTDTSEIPAPDLKKSSAKAAAKNDEISKKAAAAAKADAERIRAEMAAANAKSLEVDSTEVLTYSEGKMGTSEDATQILEQEQATDVLTGSDDDDDYRTVRSARQSEDEEATDVLKAAVDASSIDEEATDVLRNIPKSGYGADEEGEYDTTDVLTSDGKTGLSSRDVYGTYDPETTSVLKADMAPGEDSVTSRATGNLVGITYIYSETIVHTNECL